MTEETNDKDMEIRLLREAIWNIEDTLNILSQSNADHEAELIRLTRMANLYSLRLSRVEKRLKLNFAEDKYAR